MASKFWTEENTQVLVELYQSQNKPVADIATEMNTSPRSVLGKLSSLKIYKKPEGATASGGSKRVTKAAVVKQISKIISQPLEGLEAANMSSLKAILDFVQSTKQD